MNFSTLFSLAATLFVAAAEDKHQRPCNRCGKEEAEKVVRGLQAKLEEYTKQCDYKSALELSLPGAGFATVDMYCADDSCCADVGTMEKWWTYYACDMHFEYPVAPVTVEHKTNGTVVITKAEFAAGYTETWERTLSAYRQAYHWFPVASESGCDFRLGYIDGNAYNCPAFIPNAISCDNPVCTGI